MAGNEKILYDLIVKANNVLDDSFQSASFFINSHRMNSADSRTINCSFDTRSSGSFSGLNGIRGLKDFIIMMEIVLLGEI